MRLKTAASIATAILSLCGARADPMVAFETVPGCFVGSARYCVITPRVITSIDGKKEKNPLPTFWTPDEGVSDAISDLYDLRLSKAQRELWNELNSEIGPEWYRLTVTTDGNKVWSLDFYPIDSERALHMARTRELNATPEEIDALCQQLREILKAAKALSTKPQQVEAPDAE